MLRKIFTNVGLVIAVSEVGAMDADVTHPGATDPPEFLTDDSIVVGVGYTLVEGVYVAPAPLAAIRATAARPAIWQAIKALRDAKAQAGGHSTGGKWYHSDTLSRIRQLSLAAVGASLPAGRQWKTMDGTFVTMTPVLAGQVLAAAAGRDQALFAQAEALRAAVYTAIDPSSIDITAGWPASFSGA